MSHGVTDRVRLIGPVPLDSLLRMYREYDVFVLPTLYETFSLAAFEAAASGLPLVAPAVSGIEELIGDGEAGNRGIQFKAETQVPFGPSSVQAALAQSQTTGPVDGVTQLLIGNRRSTGAAGD